MLEHLIRLVFALCLQYYFNLESLCHFLQVATDQDASHPILGSGSVVHGSLLAEHGDVRRLAGRLPLHHWLVPHLSTAHL